jgi:AraC-like DNA-binding protein
MKEILRLPPGADGFAGIAHRTRDCSRTHRHEELEVNLVLTGKASYLLGARRVPLVASSMIWLFPRQEHVLIDWSHDFSMWVLVFKQTLIARCTGQDIRQVLRSADPGDIFCRQINSRSVDSLNHIYQGAFDEKNDLEFVNTALAYALVESWRAYLFSGESVPPTDLHPAVAKAARLISDSVESASLDQLSAKAGLSPARLSRLFKQQTGVSVTSFRQQKCLERFLRLYRTGARYSLIEAALLAGFGSYPQFHRVFSRLMGFTPMDYRRKVRSQAA